eukprot:TRINITY_DN6043_c0_g1_i4.p1 TRINITY_DN6043_c0_g1~~TRINITY_DN6043_c0_g1_i4.p1  ORF type:complete len:221 (-),score=105.62 TRINITY_DN6043_c0_g1_i4:109-771(-)
MFGDLKTPAGVKALNDYLAENSYIEGYVPSQADTAVFNALKGAPGADCPHALRWYNHIKSFGDGMKQFPKASKGADAYTKGASPAAAAADDDDDDVDLFGSDEEEDDEEKKRVTEERLAAYAAKKAKKPGVIAKTSVLFDVKPWDDETNMDDMLASVKSIEMDGLVWGANKLVPVGYGISKLQVMCVVEDEKVSIDELSEKIQDFEDFVQSVDIAAMNKI